MSKKISNRLPKGVSQFLEHHPEVIQIIIDLMDRKPELEPIIHDLVRCYLTIIDCFDHKGQLFICGNGGSFADSLHLAGELMKSFQRNRKLSQEDRNKLDHSPEGSILAAALEYGFPVIVLGLNHSLTSAIENDIPVPYIGFAQELFVLGREGDVLLAISTSGNAKNVIYAVITAKSIGMKTLGLTGKSGGQLAPMTDITIQVPANHTDFIQELHLHVYHTLSAIVEAHYFKEMK